MRDIEFCAGMGGMAIALQSAGFVSSNKMYEIDRYSHQSLLNNSIAHGGIIHGQPVHADIRQLDWDQVSEGGNVRLLSAGLPCQPFSGGGLRNGGNDSRNLFPVFFDAVGRMQPRAVLIENVRGLATGRMRPYLDFIISNLSRPSKNGPEYTVSYKVCNAADYGAPQIRHRIIIVAIRKDIRSEKFIFPQPTHSASKLVESIEDGSYWRRHGVFPRKCPNRLKMMVSKSNDGRKPWLTVRDVFASLSTPVRHRTADDGHYYLPGGKLYVGHTGSHIDMPAKALKAGTNSTPGGENMVVHYNGKYRHFTLREMANIQGFPNDYVIAGSRVKISRQLGNSVPIPMLHSVAKCLYKYIRI